MEEGEVRLSGYISPMEESETHEKFANQYGFVLGGGAGKRSEWQLRFDRFQFEDDDGLNFTAMGPKIAAVKDRVAVMLPFGLYWGEEGVWFDTFQVHPGLIVTPFLNDYVELNVSGKVTVPILHPEMTKWGVATVGLGLSNDLEKWALMPEVGITTNLNGDDKETFVSYGVAVVFYLGATRSGDPTSGGGRQATTNAANLK